MSLEIVEAIYQLSNTTEIPVGLICSINQVGHNNGYAFKDTETLRRYTRRLESRYPCSDVKICRDHCGPHFTSEVNKNINCDIENGFDCIHIDTCNADTDRTILARKLMKYAFERNPDIKFEVGTDENTGIPTNITHEKCNIVQLSKDLPVEFYVANTGTLVQNIYQAGSSSYKATKPLQELCHEQGVKLKEHNADYLDNRTIQDHFQFVDAMNVAPQLGVVQTITTINLCRQLGINLSDFVNLVLGHKNWEKWTTKPGYDDEGIFNKVFIAGHYHFNSPEYNKIVGKIWESDVDFHKVIVAEIFRVLNNYYLAAYTHLDLVDAR